MHTSGASRRESAGSCHDYERTTFPVVIARLDRAIQYSRDPGDGIERLRRAGYRACAGTTPTDAPVARLSYGAAIRHRAERTIDSPPYPYVTEVQLMDAHHMTFADATFDCVFAQFVITLVENPEEVLSECHRVVKPGGRIILVNHLYSETGVAGEQRGRAGGAAQGGAVRDLYAGLFRASGCVGGMSRHRLVMGIG
jgi:SAM-dependent methyltransferase